MRSRLVVIEDGPGIRRSLHRYSGAVLGGEGRSAFYIKRYTSASRGAAYRVNENSWKEPHNARISADRGDADFIRAIAPRLLQPDEVRHNLQYIVLGRAILKTRFRLSQPDYAWRSIHHASGWRSRNRDAYFPVFLQRSCHDNAIPNHFQSGRISSRKPSN